MEKQRREESGRRRKEVRGSKKTKREKKEDAGARKGRKVAIAGVFPMTCGSGGSKSRLAMRSQLAKWEMKNCTQLWHEAHFQVKMFKAHHSQTTLGSWDVEKMHAVVARSAFPSQKCKKLMVPDHFRKLRCWKSARCVARSIFPSLNVKITTCLDHFWMSRCRKSARRYGRSSFGSQKCQKLGVLSLSWPSDVETVRTD